MKSYLIVIGLLLVSMTGCLSTAAVIPVTPENAQQVQSCSNIASLHNGVVIGDFVVGAGSTGVASAAALVSDVTTKNDLAIAGIVLGALTATGTAVAGLTAVEFNSSHCTDVVGPLPARPLLKPTVWVEVPSSNEISRGAQ